MSDLILARKAVLSKRDDSILEVHGEWAFMIKSAVDEQNSEGIRMSQREYLGFQIHPESEKFVLANEKNPESVKVDAKGNYYIAVIGAEGKVINDEEIANRLAEENKLIAENAKLSAELEAMKEELAKKNANTELEINPPVGATEKKTEGGSK